MALYDGLRDALMEVARAVGHDPRLPPHRVPVIDQVEETEIARDLLGMLRMGYVLADINLQAAAAHLEGVARALDEPPIAPPALTCARGGLEAAVKVWWLLDVWDQPVRFAVRATQQSLGEARAAKGTTRQLGKESRGRDLAEDSRLQRIFRYAGEAGIKERQFNMERDMSLMEGATGAYRLTSPTAHSKIISTFRDLATKDGEPDLLVMSGSISVGFSVVLALRRRLKVQGQPVDVVTARPTLSLMGAQEQLKSLHER